MDSQAQMGLQPRNIAAFLDGINDRFWKYKE
jgi:hypothetical protein